MAKSTRQKRKSSSSKFTNNETEVIMHKCQLCGAIFHHGRRTRYCTNCVRRSETLYAAVKRRVQEASMG